MERGAQRGTSRVDTVAGIAASADFLKGPLVGALVNCLEVGELSDGLLSAPQSSSLFRRALIRTLARDPERLVAVRQRVLGTLLNRLEQADCRHARTLAHILAELVGLDMLHGERLRVLSALVNSRFSQVRTTGYNAVRQLSDDPVLHEVVQRVWKEFGDPLCAVLVVNKMPTEFLQTEFDNLDSALRGILARAKLYVRVAEKDPSVLDRLKEKDEIAWTYAKVKLGHPPLSSKDALELFWRNDTHPDLALLLWCFGQMNLYKVLLEIASHQDYFRSPKYLEKKYHVHFPRPDNVSSELT